jgi:hypothetical protein
MGGLACRAAGAEQLNRETRALIEQMAQQVQMSYAEREATLSGDLLQVRPLTGLASARLSASTPRPNDPGAKKGVGCGGAGRRCKPPLPCGRNARLCVKHVA